MITKPTTKFSNKTIARVGDILRKKSPSVYEKAYAFDIISKWRAYHAYPMNTFQVTLRSKVKLVIKKGGTFIVAQRLKRLPTIIEKLKRFPTMQLSRMQDIGGLRAILGSVKEVKDLYKLYKKTKFEHELVGENDYIASPKSSGYRGVHLVYKYKNKIIPTCDGMLLELQFRTKLQHIWATTVETMGTFSGKALKSSQGDAEWLDFFKLISVAFAYIEKTPLVPGYETLTKRKVFEEVVEAEKKLKVIDKMKGFTIAAKAIENDRNKNKGWYYHLIVLDSIKKQVQLKSYSKDELKKATSDYKKAEERASGGEKIEPVLVSAGPLASLKNAYPNYFLDTVDFIEQIEKIRKVANRNIKTSKAPPKSDPKSH